jgi:ADP-ribose pyrophosphatase
MTGKLSSRRAYSGKVVSLDIDKVEFPDGSVGELEIFRHPGAAAIVPFLSDPKGQDPQLLLIRQYRYAADGYLLEIPAGRLEDGEDPHACAVRELAEETGCTADSIEFMTAFYPTPGFCDEKIHLFMATGLHHGETNHEADEFVEPVTVKMSEALSMIESGEIRDGKTALGILFAAGYRAGV